MAGDLATARALYQRSIELNTELGEAKMVAAEHRNLAYVELNDGDERRAVKLFLRSRTEARKTEYTALSPYLVADGAVIAAINGEPARAAQLLATAESALHALGQLPDPDEAAEQGRLRERLVKALGEERFQAAYAQGAGRTVEEALSSL
jgi:hypothetical protein